MVKGIEEFSPELKLVSFRELELLEQAQVPHLNARAVKHSGSTIPKLSWSGLRKLVGVNQETRGGV